MSLVEAELGGPSVFKDLKKLDFEWLPEELPHREEELRTLARAFKSLLQGSSREHAVIMGPVGSGKTALAKRFTEDFEKAVRRQGKRLDVSYINCRRRKTSGLAMLGILNHFEPHYPERGFGVGEMQRDLRKHLDRHQSHLVVILDEVDALLRSDGSELIYDLTRFGDEAHSGWAGVSLILISQHEILDELETAARSTLKTNILRLQGYVSQQMEAIVNQRTSLAFHAGVWDPDTKLLVADIASENGDARRAIDIMRHAGMQADDEHTDQVSAEHVRSAKAHVQSHITESKLRNLQKHPQLVLLSLARRLRRDQSAYCTTGQVEEAYELACEEYGEEKRGHTMFWKYLKQLQDAGMILTRVSGKGQAGTTQHISIPDAPAKVVEAKLLTILGPNTMKV